MVKVSIEVRSGSARFDVGVQAQSIQRAMDLVAGRYPEGAIRVRFPMDPEGFSGGDPAARAGIVQPERPQKIAA